MPGSLNQFVLISARKSRGGEWSPDDYDVRDNAGKVGRRTFAAKGLRSRRSQVTASYQHWLFWPSQGCK